MVKNDIASTVENNHEPNDRGVYGSRLQRIDSVDWHALPLAIATTRPSPSGQPGGGDLVRTIAPESAREGIGRCRAIVSLLRDHDLFIDEAVAVIGLSHSQGYRRRPKGVAK